MSPVFYSRKQITEWLGETTVIRARPYLNAVSNIHWRHRTLSGDVKGTEPRAYAVDVTFRDEGDNLSIDGDCTCPIGYLCKHVAALLAANLTQMPNRQSGVRPELVSWLETFQTKIKPPKKAVSKPTEGLIYMLVWSSYRRRHEICFFKTALLSDGSLGSPAQWDNVETALVKTPKFVTEEDLGILRPLWAERARGEFGWYPLKAKNGALALQRMVNSGRLFVGDESGHFETSALRDAGARRGRISWQPEQHDAVRPVLETEPRAAIILATDPPWYIDSERAEAGTIQSPWNAEHLAEYLAMPPITLDEIPLVSAILRETVPDLPLPPAPDTGSVPLIDTDPIPVLSLDTLPLYAGYSYDRNSRPRALDFATVSFEYGGFKIKNGSNTSLLRTSEGKVVQIRRRPEIEKRRLVELRKAKLEKIPRNYTYGPKPFPPALFGLKEQDSWPGFVSDTLPTLRKGGWRVEMTPEFSFNFHEIEAIDGTLHASGDGWFDVELGISVDDRKVRLEPLLTELFRRDRRWLSGGLDAIAEDEMIQLKTDLGERLGLRADRLKPVVRVLIDLFDSMGQENLRISEWDTGRLNALEDLGRWQFQGDDSIRQMAQRLRGGPTLSPVPVPHGLRTDLRAYQHQGLSWMQFLRAQNLSGVLADDMGLGKTIQTLAHILAEKEAGRLDRPALVVVPTTLVPNWRAEADRFASGLRVLDLHGPARHERAEEIGSHDLIITTYALLWRDQAVLAKHEYHLLILDEAQYVKNAATKTALAIRELRARHRLCLTGTPLENHLGDLWAQFDFLLPGFLGSQKDFTRRWRTPIEKGGDVVRRDLLARRIRPFMLRRRKDEVAKELPPKTIIVRTVELEGGQRDLYETVRAAMQEKIRTAVAAQGLARSHIIVLDALLKLRQVCCDPRLVKLQQAARVKESVKLDFLLTMLKELIDEGRRVLLFSQFTGMLALISAALDEAKLRYVTLTGDTTDRAAPVSRFQRGEVPLFLISLKAGGVGLNLTSADTVIHYDPWWNPAVENQATDRAHRIGQDKPVFVYKLIASGSIEEKIVAMQEKKAALVDSILSEDSAGAVKFSIDDINALLAPIPAMAQR